MIPRRISIRKFMFIAFVIALVVGVSGLRYQHEKLNYRGSMNFFDKQGVKHGGGYYMMTFEDEVERAVVRTMLDLNELEKIQNAKSDLSMLAITDDEVFRAIDFSEYPNIERLALTYLDVTPESIERLCVLPKLNYLCLAHSTDRPAKVLGAIDKSLTHLRHLIVRSNHLNSADQFPSFQKIEKLAIQSKFIDDECLEEIQERFPDCRVRFHYSMHGGGGTDLETLKPNPLNQ